MQYNTRFHDRALALACWMGVGRDVLMGLLSCNFVFLPSGVGSRSERASIDPAYVTFPPRSRGASPDLKDMFLVEATLKGIRNWRCSATSDDITNTLPTPWSDMTGVVNYLYRAKLNTFTQPRA